MATEKQRKAKLEKSIAKDGKKLNGILVTRKRAIDGVVSQYTGKKNFISSAVTRKRLYKELGAEYKKLDLDINDWTVSGVEATAKDYWQFAKDDLPSGVPVETFGQFSKKHVDDILGQINPATVDATVATGAQVGGMHAHDVRTLRAAISTTIAEGAVEGLTNPQMAARMQAKIKGKLGTFQFKDRAGRNWKADNYFGMLNRTMHATAARESYAATATDAGFDLMKVVGGISPDTCEACRTWNGQILSMTGATAGYPTVGEAEADGLFHPNCHHSLRVALPSEVR